MNPGSFCNRAQLVHRQSMIPFRARGFLVEVKEKSLGRWQSFKMPLKVFIENGDSLPHFPQRNIDIAQDAFDEWKTAADGKIQFVFVKDASTADIKLIWQPSMGFVPHSSLCAVTCTKNHIEHAELFVNSKRLPHLRVNEACMKLCIMHEIGHAMGLPHSLDPDDIMYPICLNAELTELSNRDINTLKKLYSDN